MKRILFIYALCATAVAAWGVLRHKEVRRLENNQTALSEQVEYYRTRMGEQAASVQALQLRCDEFRKMRQADARRIRDLGVKIRLLESSATASLESKVEIRTIVRDTVILHDTLRVFHWRDEWVTVDGRMGQDSVTCEVTSIDTLRQVVHRVPRRFLFIRYGVKAIRQEIVSSNPHSRIVYADYIELYKRRKRKN